MDFELFVSFLVLAAAVFICIGWRMASRVERKANGSRS